MTMAFRYCAVLVTLVLKGCTFTEVVEGKLDAHPLVEPIPVSVGIYYSKEFLATPPVPFLPKNPTGGNDWQYDIVPASVSVFDAALVAAFERAVRVDTLSPPATAGVLAAIIEPRLVSASVSFENRGYGHVSSLLEYSFVIHGHDGATIDSIDLGGTAETDQNFLSPARPAQVAGRALKNAAAQLLAALATRVELRQKLEASARSAP